jgi:phenylacetate-coenzyme A ligase PaaK-like adenylate-forming protein
MQVLTTVGYGDMKITTSGEKIVTIIIMIIGVITFSFAFGSLMSVLTNLDSRAAKLKKKTFELNSIRRKYKVNSDLYNRLFKALKFEIQQDENIENFISTLPTNLKTDVRLAVNNEIISRLPYFKFKNKNF